jgi:hypothetical protein
MLVLSLTDVPNWERFFASSFRARVEYECVAALLWGGGVVAVVKMEKLCQ